MFRVYRHDRIPPRKTAPRRMRKPEGRDPKAERRPNSEIRRWLNPKGRYAAGAPLGISGFGLRVSFGLRSSEFGFGAPESPPFLAFPSTAGDSIPDDQSN